MVPLPDPVDSFDCLFEFEYENVPVSLFRCRDTGLRVASARVTSPTVHGYIAVQTEAFDDYGEPHTLEHLIFLGSESYPYKGVLDVLANRCLAQGTNAWTDTDHTCYTVDTAGSEGFLRILPVYLDHVLFPTLKDSGFVTEVHHINGEGANAGVVYCEMQARENEAGDMVDRALKLAAYPGRCSYKSNTGGGLKELRELTNVMVRDYHAKYYRPENVCVIVTGQVDHVQLCRSLEPVLKSIRSSQRLRALPPFERPFAGAVPKPEVPALSRLDFPAEDEKTGAICKFAWHGPSYEDFETNTALSVMLAYLTKDAVAPLRKALVETEPPFCGEISVDIAVQTVYLVSVSLESVDMEQLQKRDIGAEVTTVLQALVKDDGAGIDMERMASVLKQARRKHLSEVEEGPHNFFGGELISSFMYAPDFGHAALAGPSGSSLRKRLEMPSMLSALLAWPAKRWADLTRRWMLEDANPRITVIGTPSKQCGERIQAEDAARIEAQKAKLGDAGCKAAGDAVDKAEAENDVDTPDEVAERFVLPDTSKIALIDVCTVAVDGPSREVREIHGNQAGKIKAILEAAGAEALPGASMQFDHVPGAQFVDCCVLVPTDGIPDQELEVLPLWMDVAFSLPLSASEAGPAMTHEEAVHAIDDVAVSQGFSLGQGGDRFTAGMAGNMISVVFRVEKASYSEAPRWIARVLADAVFNTERLGIAAKRILNDVPNVKRNASGLAGLAMTAMRARDDSVFGVLNAFRQERVLQKTTASSEGIRDAATKLEKVREKLLRMPKLLRVAGDIEGLGGGDALLAPWRRCPFVSKLEVGKMPLPALARDFFAANAVRPKAGATLGCLIFSSAEESNYWTVQRSCLTDPRSPELAPLLVAMEYLTALEGPFWRKIRGKGLSYSYSLSNNTSAGTISFGLFKATDPVAAFVQAGLIVRRLCGAEAEGRAGGPGEAASEGSGSDGEEEDDEDEDEDEVGIDPMTLEAAQSGVVFELIESVDTIPGAVDNAFGNTLSRSPPDQLQWLLREVQAVTVESVGAALRKHVLPLFDGSDGRVVSLACPEKNRKKVLGELRKLSPPLQVLPLSVDDLVKTLSSEKGFDSLRAKVQKGGGRHDREGKSKGKARAGSKPEERRVDPADGIAYTHDEIAAFYAGKYKKSAIEEYWRTLRSSVEASVERRVDPEDGVAYTFSELVAYYTGKYKRAAIKAYWDSDCVAVRAAPKAKAKAKAKAKVKAKAKSRG